ncbi:MAG: 50S ribosomal protein L29 [Candidatus Improbicoccus pseudotrichonymphae]|uniref:Large ribosomal subunit protein uL29 n=1 Tax=Candidatus Improbicoccus pseudotrichonymphae TaxID=3033792 RepID=A0AA48KV72_9FIRM|nr:MAG: 50S ribosomal protein L29 [Candidatus Improbicoccus pseudotrichonymphae]
MKAVDVRKLSLEEIDGKIKDYKSELFNLRFQLSINQLKNIMRICKVKKNIARLLTVRNEIVNAKS